MQGEEWDNMTDKEHADILNQAIGLNTEHEKKVAL